MKTQRTLVKIAGTNPTHNTWDRSPCLKARMPTTRAETERINAAIIKPNPATAPTFSLLASSMIGRITEVNIPSIGNINRVPKPRPIAHQAVLVFGFSLNLLIISFFIFLFYQTDPSWSLEPITRLLPGRDSDPDKRLQRPLSYH